MTDTHVRFLNDTLDFIKTGSRQIEIQTWERLIGYFKADTVSIKPSQFNYKDYFGMGKPALFHKPLGITNAIQAWVSQPGGMEDMIYTLKILFGDPIRVE